ncbi:MAG: hypothetical protein LCH38_07965 [Proteobacteria bacterium]|nr:hypothetical protein [Pseudomonadota bacterium]
MHARFLKNISRRVTSVMPAVLAMAFIDVPVGAQMRPSACDPADALPTRIMEINAEGVLTTQEGITLRLAQVVWPDHLEPLRRAQVLDALASGLKDQRISWKPAGAPDRWRHVPAHLFVQEPGGAHTPFWLQAGLVEAGLLPAWPNGAETHCLARLEAHEQLAIRARRGYWGPRSQARRLLAITRAPEAHAGQHFVALWRVRSVRAWRHLHFVNIAPSFRASASLALTQKLHGQFIALGRDPAGWGGKRIVFRVTPGAAGLTRLRVDSVNHVAFVE